MYRKINFTIIIFVILYHSTMSLSLSGKKQYNAEQYANALITEQKQFEQKIAEVKLQINYVQSIIDNTTITNQVKVIQLTQGIADQRNTLYDIQQVLKLPFELRACKCAKLDEESRNKVTQKINNISEIIHNTRNSLKKCDQEKCPRYQQIALELSQSQNYLKIMNQTINAECCKTNFEFVAENATGLVDLKGTIYKDNLNGKNWFYGAIDMKNYTLQRFQLTTKFNLTSCPLQTPYVDLIQNNCGRCELQQEYFNLGDRKCYSCGDASYYMDLKKGVCTKCPALQYFNLVSKTCQQCPRNTAYNSITKKCQTCPRNSYPSSNFIGCQKCPPNQFYNLNSFQCQSCNAAAGQYLNQTTFTCNKCPFPTFYASVNQSCVSCPTGTFYSSSLSRCVSCPSNAYFDNLQNVCKACPNGSYFNSISQKCLYCPSGTIYNSTLKICAKQVVNNPNSTSVTNSTSTSTTTNTTDTTITTDTSPRCPADKPYYNQYLKACDVCSPGYTLDAQNNICKPNNFISSCPPSKPLYNATTLTCLPCPANSQYDPLTHICKGILCQQGYFLNTDTLKCISYASTCTGDQQYDFNQHRCIDLSQKCNKAIQTYSSTLKKCVPFSQACQKGYYFNTISYRCISVTSLCRNDQYYSYSSNQCQSLATTCSLDQYYNQTSHRCESKSSVCTIQQYYNKTLHECRLNSQLCKPDQIYKSETQKCIPISSTCNIDQVYNPTIFKCQQKSSKCTADQVYIRQQHQCIQRSLFCSSTQFYSTNLHGCVQGSTLCRINQYYNKPTNSCLLISSLCARNGTVYDLQTNRCIISCPNGYQLNKITNKCQQIIMPTLPTTSVTTGSQCQPDQKFLQDIGLCVKTSTTCTTAQFYNPSTSKCQTPTYITSPYVPNLLINTQQFAAYEQYYRTQVDKYKNVQGSLRDCPVEKPYYDILNKICIVCPTQANIFNLQTSTCQKCPDGTVYSSAEHKCLRK